VATEWKVEEASVSETRKRPSVTVAELIAALSRMPQDADVWLSRDGTSCRYEPIWNADWDCIVDPRERGRILSGSWSADEADMDEEEWAKLKAGPRVVVLSP
jgi:hypothetical protein